MRADPVSLGALAAAEADGNESWAEDTYAYGPLSLGITAAAVNEAAQHCEDLFALLRFLREPIYFARDMANYGAGKVVEFGRKLDRADDATISQLFLVPPPEVVREGLTRAGDPDAAVAHAEEGRVRLGAMVRETATFYRSFEDFHVQYKHGLKLPLRPFGTPTEEAIDERKTDLEAPLFSYTTEPIESQARRSPTDQPIMFKASPAQRADLLRLVRERNLLRLQMVAKVGLDELVERSHTVLRLLQIAQENRLALGRLEEGNQRFVVPGLRRWEQVEVLIGIDRTLSLNDFADPTGSPTNRGKRRRR
ncbi:hypothetical protein Cwoe_4921 [Conexibacter woesei DSM 14684]|uniref:Uncharacterized protein n=2 Tax=Conexibacter TaxID=191494 RepID=D3FC38_CONWI|nr:hypothetical protein Cwoe_4921 [Conexibacter woesei DSM 14684]